MPGIPQITFFEGNICITNLNNIKYIILNEIINDDDCSICLDEYKIGDEIYITKCNHKFHKKCIIKYIEYNNNYIFSCPLCRQINYIQYN